MSGEGDKSMTGMDYIWPGKVTLVIDPFFFWMQLGTWESMQQFEQLQWNLQQFCGQGFQAVESKEKLENGQLVIVDTGSTDSVRFKRAIITRILTSDDNVDVFYVDYGNTELSCLKKICASFPVQFKVPVPQAVRCSLAGVRPISKNWTSRGTKTFQKLAMEGIMNVIVMLCEQGFCEVSLYPNDGDNARSISHCLLDEEVAMPIEDRPVPEYINNSSMANILSGDEQTVTKSQDSSSSTTKPATPSTEKYIPPHQKNLSSSPSTQAPPTTYTQQLTPPGFEQTSPHKPTYPPAKSPIKNTPIVESKTKEPVNDFFPFENVSVYPGTPTSPVKSPEKPVSAPPQGQGHYQGQGQGSFTRSPIRGNMDNQNNSKSSVNGRYGVGDSKPEFYHRPNQSRTPEKTRFAANFDNLPTNTFEPSYLNNQAEFKPQVTPYQSPNKQDSYRNPDNYQSPNNYRSPEKNIEGGGSNRPRPRLNIPSRDAVPFYPPKQPDFNTGDHSFTKSTELHPPGFYMQQRPPTETNQAYYESSPNRGYGGQANDRHAYQYYDMNRSDRVNGPYQKDNGRNGGIDSHNTHNSFNDDGELNYSNNSSNSNANYGYSQKISPERSDNMRGYVNSNNNNHQSNSYTALQSVHCPNETKYYNYGPGKQLSDTSDSASIAGFNFEELGSTHMISKDVLIERRQQERLKALQEEHEDIARESQEQSALYNSSRYGSKAGDNHSDELDDYEPEAYPDIQTQLADESIFSNKKALKEPDERYSTRNTVTQHEVEVPRKLDGIPLSYIVDINFTDVVRETLDFAHEEGNMENTKALLDGIVESVKTANVEKQLYDMLATMLSYAILHYNQFHLLIIDTISNLTDDMDIKESLLRAVKKQLEKCIRVPASKKYNHQNCARVMGHVYNLSITWNDNKSTIADFIIQTAEKWVLFNNKGQQIGQQEKENIFLDCFTAFWEISGQNLLHGNRSFIERIQSDLKMKLLNENVARCIRERLLDDIYMLLYCVVPEVQKQTVACQTPRKTMIPSSCQVKPATAHAATYTLDDFNEEDFYAVDPDKPWAGPSTEYTSPDTEISLRPFSIPMPKNQSSPLTSSMLNDSEASDSVYVTPKESMNNDSDVGNSTGQPTPKSNLTEAFKECGDDGKYEAIDEMDESVSENAKGRGKNVGSPKTDTDKQQRDKKVPAKIKTVSERISATGRSIVDWFDYEPPSAEKSTAIEEKKLKTKKRLDSASMNIIESEIETSKVETKSKNKKEKRKGKTEGKSDESVKADNKDGVKDSINKGDIDAPICSEKESDTKNKGARKNEPSASEESSKRIDPVGETINDANQAEVMDNEDKVVEDWDNCFDKKVGMDFDKNIDWWGAGGGEEFADFNDVRDLRGTSDIYTDYGPDVIIEEEFEQEVSEITEQFDELEILDKEIPEPETNEPDNDLMSQEKNDDGTLEVKDNEVAEYKPDTNDNGKTYKDDIIAFDVDQNWESDADEDDFELNGSEVKGYNADFPESDLSETIKPAEVEPAPQPPQGVWVPGERKCFNCHDTDHTTDRCPNRIKLL